MEGNDNNNNDNTEEDNDMSAESWLGRKIISQRVVPQLFGTSRDVYHESAPIYFRYNVFDFGSLDSVASFVNSLPAISRRAITSVVVDYNGYRPAMATKALTTCLGLQHLRIHFTSSSVPLIRRWYIPGNRSWERLFGLKDLLRIRGIKELEVTRSEPSNDFLGLEPHFQDWQAFTKVLQVLKEPHTKQQLTRQSKKDFPQKATREVFGRTNVATRAERRFTRGCEPN